MPVPHQSESLEERVLGQMKVLVVSDEDMQVAILAVEGGENLQHARRERHPVFTARLHPVRRDDPDFAATP
ncbi:MAG: hypothetical protein OXE94_10190 [Aestuariivita sp.]|nr:hypothetical protein [Aestuariivita sp.]MCY4202822.1 hypothetical protein [Aestuariivita sp.]